MLNNNLSLMDKWIGKSPVVFESVLRRRRRDSTANAMCVARTATKKLIVGRWKPTKTSNPSGDTGNAAAETDDGNIEYLLGAADAYQVVTLAMQQLKLMMAIMNTY